MKKNLFLLLSLIFVAGCAHVISKDFRTNVDPSLTFIQVHQNPNTYKGKLVVWGGEIIETINQKDGTTEIEVFQRPLGCRGEPKVTLASEGRFLILNEKYLDPYIYWRGRKITVAGEILGEKIKPLCGMDYRYPLLSSKQIYLWEEYYYHPVYYYPYYYYEPYPWWYWYYQYPYYWRYPYPHWWRDHHLYPPYKKRDGDRWHEKWQKGREREKKR